MKQTRCPKCGRWKDPDFFNLEPLCTCLSADEKMMNWIKATILVIIFLGIIPYIVSQL